MGLLELCEQQGITLVHGALYSADALRDITRKLHPDYVRSTGIESIDTARFLSGSGRASDLSRRIPNTLEQRSPIGDQVRLDLCFEPSSVPGFGTLSFRYDPKAQPAGYRFDNYLGSNNIPHPKEPLTL